MRSLKAELVMSTKHVKKSFLLSAILLVSLFATGQIGFKAGIGFSDVVFSDEGQAPYLGYETDYLTHRYPLLTYQIGFTGLINLNKHFDFEPELLFVKQGLNYNMDIEYDEIVNRVYLFYLQIPAAFRYKFSLKKKHHPNFFLGPYFAFLVHSKRIKTYDGNTETGNVENIKPYDFGFVTGFGYDFNLKSDQITAEFRVGYSLINVMNTLDGYIPEYDVTDNTKARNINATIIVGYRFSHLFKKRK